MSQRAPEAAARRRGGLLVGVALMTAALAAVVAVVWAVRNVSGLGRGLVAFVIGAMVLWLGVGYFRQLGNPPPPDPGPVDVDPELQLAYVCEMCGLEMAILKAGKERPPSHCGEKMSLVRLT